MTDVPSNPSGGSTRPPVPNKPLPPIPNQGRPPVPNQPLPPTPQQGIPPVPNKPLPPIPGGKPAPPNKPLPPTPVTAKEFDTLCSIAVEKGFADCSHLRSLPENQEYNKRPLRTGDKVYLPPLTPSQSGGATEQKHEFVRRGLPLASIRFVHGSPSLPYKEDPTMLCLKISNYQTDKAGKNRKKKFVNDNYRKFQQHAHDDEDTFKVEVRDLRTDKKDLKVEIDALKPIYNAAGTVTGHEMFEGDRTAGGTEANKRSLDAIASKQGKKKETRAFRTCYLRLVSDEFDKGLQGGEGRPKQALLVTDMVDAAVAADAAGDANKAKDYRRVEILDQKIRAKYEIEGCAAASGQVKCQVMAEVPVGDQKKKVKVAIHVMKKSRGGAPIIPLDKVRDRFLKYVREMYAQANASIELVADTRGIEPPLNLLTISNRDGKLAQGGKKIKVKVEIDGTEHEAEITTTANAKPIATAIKLAQKIRQKFGGGLQMRVSENPPIRGKAYGSADILIGDPMTQDIDVTEIDSQDNNHTVEQGWIDPTASITDFAGDESHVGTPEERVIVKNYDTGKNHIDSFVIEDLAGAWGEAFTPNFKEASKHRPLATVVNTLVLGRRPVAEDNFQLRTIAHELGHILMDCGHATDKTELMFRGGVPGMDYNQGMKATKRLADPQDAANNVDFGGGDVDNPTNMLRTRNGVLFKGW